MLYEILDKNPNETPIFFVLAENSKGNRYLPYQVTYRGKIVSSGVANFYKRSEDPDLTKSFSYTVPAVGKTTFNDDDDYTFEVGWQLRYTQPNFLPGEVYSKISFNGFNSSYGKVYTISIVTPTVFHYYREITNSNPSDRIQYSTFRDIAYTDPTPTYFWDYNNFAPIKITSGTVSYNGWENYIKSDFRPCRVLHTNLTTAHDNGEDYIEYLNINDYTKLENGEDSLITKAASGYDYFIQIWGNNFKYMCQFEVDNVQHILFSDYPITRHFKANPFIGEDGKEKTYLYLGMFRGVFNSSDGMYETNGNARKATVNRTIQQIYQACYNSHLNNNPYWPMSYIQYDYIRSLLTMFFKTDNLQSACGAGVGYSNGVQQNNSVPAALKDLFLNQNSTSKPIYVLGMQDLWGNSLEYLSGLVVRYGDYVGKTHPPFNTSGEGYTYSGYGINPNSATSKFILYGSFSSTLGCWLPRDAKSAGSSTTYYCDVLVYQNLTTQSFNVATNGLVTYSGSQTGPYGLAMATPGGAQTALGVRMAFVTNY